MKRYRNAAATLLLVLTLSTSTLAGVIHTDGSPQPAPTPAATSETPTGSTDGEIHTGETTDAPAAMAAVTETALTLLQSLLSLI